MQASMAAQFNNLADVAKMCILLQIGRFAWRSSVLVRHALFEYITTKLKMQQSNSRSFITEKLIRREKFKFIFAIEVQVEMLLENAAIGFTIFMQWIMSDIRVFNAPVPSSISYPFIFETISIQWIFQISADIVFLILNSKRVAGLPFQYVFKEIMKEKRRFFSFIGKLSFTS